MNKKQAAKLAKKLAEQEALAAAEAAKQEEMAAAKAAEEAAREAARQAGNAGWDKYETAGDDYTICNFAETVQEEAGVHGEEVAAKYAVEHWPEVRDALKKQMVDGKKLTFSTVRIDHDAHHSDDGCHMDFENTIRELDMILNNAGEFEAMLTFGQDMLDIFDFSENQLDWDNFRNVIGEALHRLGRKEERDRYFMEILDHEKNAYVAGFYVGLLLDDEEVEKSEKILADYKDSDEPMIVDRLRWIEDLKKEGKA